METNRLEFDKPRNKKVPPGVSIVQHVASRIREINRLYNDIATTKSEMLLHQMLPNHMRRRAMSHNPKRLPLKYRQIHTNQMAKSGPTAKKRRPSRKYRRKPSSLLREFERRKQKNVWLETHVWHAKRYHMKDLWGYKIPYASTDKRYRASYKAAANHCLVQDMSFVSAIEVRGQLEDLRDGFKRITSQDCGLTLMAKCYQNGSREGDVDVFKADSYPNNAIARVSFIWNPIQDSSKALWIFVHPSSYLEVLQELITVFSLQNANRANSNEVDAKTITKNNSMQRNPRYTNSASTVEIIELKDTLSRFRLTGPLSNAVLLKALSSTTQVDSNWLGEIISKNVSFKQVHEEQSEFWHELKNISSTSQLPPHIVLGLNIVDPRINRPLIRKKAVNEGISLNSSFYPDVPLRAAFSSIWDKELRDRVTKNIMTTGDLCKLRNKNQLVPGISSSFENDLQPLPILLIQRPGNQTSNDKRLGFGSGWDVVIPSGYGLSIWLSIIRCGAKSGGWRETETIASEMGVEVFMPDTVAGLKESYRLQKLKREEFFRKPPNKRTNYSKMGISSPFSSPFRQLVMEWNGGEEFHVLRNKNLLQGLKEVFMGKMSLDDLKIASSTLLPVTLSMNTRGTPGDLGIVCVPTKRDIKSFLAKKYQRDHGPIHVEPLIKDDQEKERKMLRTDHKKLLKRLRNRRVRAKRKIQATANYHVKIQKSSAEKIIQEQHDKICEMWLPKQPLTVRNQCSRPVIGYLTKSRFTFSEGKVSGIGYVTKNGLACLLNVFQKFKGLEPFVLTRGTNCKCYYTAKWNIRVDL